MKIISTIPKVTRKTTNINIAMGFNSTNPENLNIQTKNSDFTGKNQLELNEKILYPL